MERYLVKPRDKVDLSRWDPNDHSGFSGGEKKAEEHLAGLVAELQKLQEVLYAERKHKILVVLQAMDTGGKDGAIRHIFGPLNPQGVRVSSFKKPSQEEADHDFLWRIHPQAPGNGEIVIFNRSHYEDVLVVRVHNLVPEAVWSRRYAIINNFEEMLAAAGTVILKFYLHIDLDEQKKRLQARIDDPSKHWKLSPSDLPERARWADYALAYQDVLAKTSTKRAPWYIVPANHKWYRNVVIATALVDALKKLDMKHPEPALDVASLKIV